ncbi:fatty acid desaturase [Lichenifustis flavocetrariae]|uniref:Fatty acid desaturase n=1 Tax=Lichenifustis flavocetrariae TaxID=2949735 RepID=A0AA41Z0S5_9HYPH|nr:fatty acid desaturase [Lichenifustis flavocetrariae]MCW6508335.1 fatty acid desaturase [Lichenifustis flavocetrariae]
MSISELTLAPAVSAREWAKKLGRYRQPSTWRSIYELAVTLLPFVGCWIGMACAITFGYYWLFALLLVPTAGLVVRLFMIQHDCGHGSFFPARAANDWTGRLVGILTMTPYDYWRRTHAIHHATAGNLDSRGIGDVDTLTVAEYLARSPWGRLRYRLYRHPAIMFGVGPAYLFVLQYRLPLGFMGAARPWLSTMSTNLAIGIAACLLMWQIGVLPFLLVHIPVVLLAAAGGVWLFYIQHQFEETHWAKDKEWTLHEAALHGSSHYDLPFILRWFTANIGIHHVHHLSSRIPYYRLSAVLRDHPELRSVGRITLWQSFACVRLVLWDEARQRMISFRELPRGKAVPAGV